MTKTYWLKVLYIMPKTQGQNMKTKGMLINNYNAKVNDESKNQLYKLTSIQRNNIK